MGDIDLKGMLTNKIGPLPGWAWGLTAAVGAYALMAFKGKSGKNDAPAGMVRDPVTGEFKSASSTETVDPVTGKRSTSSYEASGPLGGWGGGVGTPMGYPMPSQSSGDVYVNLPGDQPNMNPAQPIETTRGNYPPKTGPGFEPGKTTGGYWFTPQTWEDVWWTVERSGAVPKGSFTHMKPEEQEAALVAMAWARMMVANPQVDWANKHSVQDWIGTPMYVPRGDGNWGFMPPNASLNAPANYNPPAQQTSVSVAT